MEKTVYLSHVYRIYGDNLREGLKKPLSCPNNKRGGVNPLSSEDLKFIKYTKIGLFGYIYTIYFF